VRQALPLRREYVSLLSAISIKPHDATPPWNTGFIGEGPGRRQREIHGAVSLCHHDAWHEE